MLFDESVLMGVRINDDVFDQGHFAIEIERDRAQHDQHSTLPSNESDLIFTRPRRIDRKSEVPLRDVSHWRNEDQTNMKRSMENNRNAISALDCTSQNDGEMDRLISRKDRSVFIQMETSHNQTGWEDAERTSFAFTSHSKNIERTIDDVNWRLYSLVHLELQSFPSRCISWGWVVAIDHPCPSDVPRRFANKADWLNVWRDWPTPDENSSEQCSMKRSSTERIDSQRNYLRSK